MEKKILLSVVVAGLFTLSITGAVFAGIEPVPWEPEINKLHSIELNIAAIEKRLVKLSEFETLPGGTANYLDAMINQLGMLDTRLADTLYLLPSFSDLGTATDEVLFTLYAIRADASSMNDIFGRIVARMGVEPTPWMPVLESIIGRISGYLGTAG
jgi:hypothetical protein